MKKRQGKKKRNFDWYFLLSWRKVWMIIVGWFLAVILHNAVYAIAMYFFNVEFEGALFFIIAVVVIPIYALVVLIYSLVWVVVKKWLKK